MKYIMCYGPNAKFGGFIHEHKSYLGASPLAVATMRADEQFMRMLIQAVADPESEYPFVLVLQVFLERPVFDNTSH